MQWQKHAITLMLTSCVACSCAMASPWAEVGDSQTRSDVELAAASGLINNITMQWPLPWTSILGSLQDESRLDALPADVRDAVERLQEKGKSDLHVGLARAEVLIDVTGTPATVRGYDALGRAQQQGQISYEYLSTDAALRLAVGAQKSNPRDSQALVFDSSYIAHRIDGVVVYAGYLQHWWGPGWISALSVSNSARPVPQVGLSRVHTDPSQSWLLSWLGPWQFETFVGLLDGPRVAENTAFVAVRFAFNPLDGLEIGLSRVTQMCGSGHPCRPLVDYFTFSNDDEHVNSTNEQANIDFRYTGTLLSRPYAVYAQFMNDDTNPIIVSGTSRVYGGSIWLPIASLSSRLTFEYANSIASRNVFWGGAMHGFSYNNGRYADGMRYRGRTLGFSLDSDSILYSIQASLVDRSHRTLTLTYHRALVSHPLNSWGNVVTAAPVRFNAVEARIGYPVKWGMYNAKIDTSIRWQDDQPRPKRGSDASVELALRFGI